MRSIPMLAAAAALTLIGAPFAAAQTTQAAAPVAPPSDPSPDPAACPDFLPQQTRCS